MSIKGKPYKLPELIQKSRQVRFSDIEWRQLMDAANAVDEDMAEFIRQAVRQRILWEVKIKETG